MSSKFLQGGGSSGLEDGTANININSATIQSLQPNFPIKTNSSKTLVSTLLATSDTVGLDTALSEKATLGFVNQGSSPATPSAGNITLFSKISDKSLYTIDELGIETNLGTGGGGGGNLEASWLFNTSTGGAVASGDFRTDNATPLSITEIVISTTNSSGGDNRPLLSTLTSGDNLYMCNTGMANCKLINITDVGIDNTTYFTFPCVLESQNNVANYSNAESVSIHFYITSDTFEELTVTEQLKFGIGSITTPPSGEIALYQKTGYPNNLHLVDDAGVETAVIDRAVKSTGIRSGGVLSVGVPNTSISITDGTAIFIDDDPLVSGEVTQIMLDFTGLTNITVTNIGSQLVTYITIDNTGSVQQYAQPPSAQKRREECWVGVAVHTDLATISLVNSIVDYSESPNSQMRDIASALGYLNIGPNLLSDTGSGLTYIKSYGQMFALGSNYSINPKSPNITELPIKNTSTGDDFQYRTSTGTDQGVVTDIDPNNFESPLGTISAVTNNNYTIQHFHVFPSNQIRVQYGQDEYKTFTAAVGAIGSEDFTTETNIAENGILIGYLVIQEGVTNLNTAITIDGTAKFYAASKFGGGVASSSGSQDFQDIYNNSTVPQITTSTLGGALTILNGQADDQTIQLEVKDIASNTTFSVSGDGNTVITHTAIQDDEHSFEIIHDAAGFGDTKAVDIIFTTGAQAAGTEEEAILVNVDKSLSVGGENIGLEMLVTEGLSESIAVSAGADVACIHQRSGQFAFTDPLTMEIDLVTVSNTLLTSSNRPFFVADNDTIQIYDTSTFEEIELLFSRVASHNCQLTFEYGYSTGPLLWSSFTPTDSTNGCTNNGIIGWLAADVPLWDNASGLYRIRITRTRNNLNTTPLCADGGLKVAAVQEFTWDKNADLTVNDITANDITISNQLLMKDHLSIRMGDPSPIFSIIPRQMVAQGSDNIFISDELDSVYSGLTGASNIVIGGQGNFGNATTASANISIGVGASVDNVNTNETVVIGHGGAENVGTGSTFVGYRCGARSGGQNLTGVGRNAFGRFTSGFSTVAADSVGIGDGVLNKTEGACNVSVGSTSMQGATTASNSTCCGCTSGYNITTAENVTLVGSQSDVVSATGSDNSIGIGYNVRCGANDCVFGNDGLAGNAGKSINILRSGANNLTDLGSSLFNFKDIYSTGNLLSGTISTGNIACGNIFIEHASPVLELQDSDNVIASATASIDFKDSADSSIASVSVAAGDMILECNTGDILLNGTSSVISERPIIYDAGNSIDVGFNGPGGSPGVVFSQSSTNDYTKCVIRNKSHSTPSSRYLQIDFNNVGVRLLNGSTSWSTTSDRSLKRDIVELTGCCDKLANIHGYTFNYKSDDEDRETRIGVMADEVKAEYPQLVDCIDVTEPNGTELENICTVRYVEMVPVLIQCINEMRQTFTTEINNLKADIELLKK